MFTFAKDPKEVFLQFNRLIEKEYDGFNNFLDEEDIAVFRKYYSPAFSNKARRPFYGYVNAQRLEYTISLVLDNPQTRILDAGCGLGSESILFGLLGAEVIGVDLDRARLGVARKRIAYYNKLAKKRIKVRFLNSNVFKILESGNFDIIWSNASISHIHPAEEFIKASYRCLNNGGKLIVSDENLLNLYVAIKKLIKTGSLKTTISKRKDLLTGEVISYAHERLFTVYQMKNMFNEAGFIIERMETSHFIPTILIPNVISFPLVKKIEHFLENFPVLRRLGTDYRVIGIKSL